MTNFVISIIIEFLVGINMSCSLTNMNASIISDYLQAIATNFQLSLLQTIINIGLVVGTLVTGYLTKYVTKKKLAILLPLIGLGLNFLNCLQFNYIYLLTIRFLTGCIISIMSVIIPSFILNQATEKQRSILTSSFQLFICSGFILSAISNFLYQQLNFWRCGIVITQIINIFCIVCSCFLQKEQQQDEQIAEQIQEKYQKLNRKQLLIAIALGVGQQFSGINIALFYAEHLISYKNAQFIVSTINLVFSGISFIFVNVSKRKLILSGYIILVVSHLLLLLSPFYTLDLLATIVIIFAFECFIGPLFFQLNSELFGASRIQSISFFVNYSSNIIVVFLYPIMRKATFILTISCLGFCFYILVKYLPETKNKTLAQIQQELNGSTNNKAEESVWNIKQAEDDQILDE